MVVKNVKGSQRGMVTVKAFVFLAIRVIIVEQFVKVGFYIIVR